MPSAVFLDQDPDVGERHELYQAGDHDRAWHRLCLRQCFSTKIRTSASVTSSIRPGIMIGRGNGRDQFGAGNAVSSSRKRNHYYLQNVVGGGKASVRCRLAHRLGPSKKFSRG